jgi:hypothetical protein
MWWADPQTRNTLLLGFRKHKATGLKLTLHRMFVFCEELNVFRFRGAAASTITDRRSRFTPLPTYRPRRIWEIVNKLLQEVEEP